MIPDFDTSSIGRLWFFKIKGIDYVETFSLVIETASLN
jgi:hypothetical protein